MERREKKKVTFEKGDNEERKNKDRIIYKEIK